MKKERNSKILNSIVVVGISLTLLIPKLIKGIGMCAFSEFLLFNFATIVAYYILDMYLYSITIFSIIIVSFVSIAIGFFSLVSANLFELSIEIKEENDKTI